MKTTFQKLKPRIVQYKDYTQFFNDNFRKKLLENLSLKNVNTNSNGIDQMTPRKKKYIRGNNKPFFNTKLSSAHKKERN